MAIHDTIIAKPYVYIDDNQNSSTQVAPEDQTKGQLDIENEVSLVNLYPNPSKNEVNLMWKDEPKIARVKIYSPLGIQVLDEEWKIGDSFKIEVGGWRQGAYFVIIETPTETIRRNLLISR